MDNKCLCNCRCGKLYQAFKVYELLENVRTTLISLNLNIEYIKEKKANQWTYENALSNAEWAYERLKRIHDKYARALGMEDE